MLRCRGRVGGGDYQSGRANRNGLDLAKFAAHLEPFSVEAEVEAAGVSDLHDDLFAAMKGELTAGFEELRGSGFAIDGNRDPA